jgi:hypothetical protein
LKVHDANHYTTTPSHLEIVWMFSIYLTTFSLEIRYYIVGAENRFKPKFHDMISISFLHNFYFDSIPTTYVKQGADECPKYRRRAMLLS